MAYYGTTTRQPIYVIGPSIAYIPLHIDGLYTIVDTHLAAFVAQWNWGAWEVRPSVFYARRNDNNGKAVLLHRVLRPTTEKTVDHVNRHSLDNRQGNLRPASYTTQCRNQNLRKDNRTGIKGVFPVKTKWVATIRVNKHLKHLGTFRTFSEAVAIRKEAEKVYFG